MSAIVLKSLPLLKDLEDVTFVEPFNDTTKRLKRGLIVSSFIGCIVGVYSVKIDSFFGFKVTEGSISPSVLSGILAIIVVYYLLSYSVYLIADLMAWDYKREIVKVKPYIDIFHNLNKNIVNLTNSVDIANTNAKNIYLNNRDREIDDAIHVAKMASEEIKKLRDECLEFKNVELPKLIEKEEIVRTVSKLRIRLILRFFSLFLMDILVPIILCLVALVKTYYGIESVVMSFI